jgi:hypothetical protein
MNPDPLSLIVAMAGLGGLGWAVAFWAVWFAVRQLRERTIAEFKATTLMQELIAERTARLGQLKAEDNGKPSR